MAVNALPFRMQFNATVAISCPYRLGFSRVAFTPCDSDTGQELTNEQKRLLRYRFRVRVWQRPLVTDNCPTVHDRTFIRNTADPLTGIVVDPASRVKIEVEALSPDHTVCAHAVLAEQFTRPVAFRLVFDPENYNEDMTKVRTYVPRFGVDLGIDTANFMFVCQRGAGKSSTINSGATVLDGNHYVSAAVAQPAQGGGVTYGFNVVHGRAFGARHIKFIDSPGVTFDQLSFDAMGVLFDYIARGRIKLPYVFAGRDRPPTADELRERYFNVPDAPLRDRVHVVGIVFDETTFANAENTRKMLALCEVLSKHCRVVGIVTGADRLRRTPMIGNVPEFAGVDEHEIELNLDRVSSFAEANSHLLTMAENAQMDVKNVLLTSNLLGASPTDEDVFGRCVLTGNMLRVMLDRADDLFAAEYAHLINQLHLDNASGAFD